MKPEAIPFFKPDDDASPSAAEAQEGSPSAAEAQEGSPSAAEAQEGPPPRPLPPTAKEETSTKDPLLTTMGTNPPPAGKSSQPPSKDTPPMGTDPRRSRCRRKGCPSPHEASFARRETRQKGRRVSAVALFSAPLRKTLFFFCGRCAISFCDNYNHTCC